MNGNTEKADKIAALYGMVWFVMIIDACFTWFLPEIIRYVIGTFFVILATLKLFQNNGIKLPSDRQSIILSVCVLTLFMILKFNIFKILIYFPLLCFILWRNSALLRMYSYFRAFVLFYALVSIFVEVLVLTRLWVQLPTLAVFPPQNGVQEVLGYNNYFYGLFSIPAANTSLTFYRACGPLMEGGHFVFFLGFVYFVEFGIYGKRNWWLIICMILTLSPNCLIFFLFNRSIFFYQKQQVPEVCDRNCWNTNSSIFIVFSIPTICKRRGVSNYSRTVTGEFHREYGIRRNDVITGWSCWW